MRHPKKPKLVASCLLTFVLGCTGRTAFVGPERPEPPLAITNGWAWRELPGTLLKDACPADNFGGATYEFSFFCRNVIKSGGGAIADTTRNRLLMWGGINYLGNEIYALELGLETPQLVRLNTPTLPLGSSNCEEEIPAGVGGFPNARALGGGLAYAEQDDRLFVYGGTLICTANTSSNATWFLNLDDLTWERREPVDAVVPGFGLGANAVYDPLSGDIFGLNENRFWRYNVAEELYTTLIEEAFLFSYNLSSAIDPVRGLFIAIGGGLQPTRGGVRVIRLNPEGAYVAENWTDEVTGCNELINARAPGIAYHPESGLMVGWPNFGNTIYLFNPDTRTCTAHTFPGGPPASSHDNSGMPNSLGTYNRWAYFPDLQAFALVNDWDINAYLLETRP